MSAQSRKSSVASLIGAELDGWVASQGDLSLLLVQTARSLETVTKLTQYEDEKANRLLTAIAFVSAFVATLFATIPSRFPPGSITLLWSQSIHYRAVVLASVYVLFCIYAVLIGLGVAFIVHGVRPRFMTPKDWRSGEKPKSLLFFQRIIETEPTEWARAFSQVTGDDLSMVYIKNSIMETYLIAQKIDLKVRWLTRGVACFFSAAVVVIPLICAIVLTLLTTANPTPIPLTK